MLQVRILIVHQSPIKRIREAKPPVCVSVNILTRFATDTAALSFNLWDKTIKMSGNKQTFFLLIVNYVDLSSNFLSLVYLMFGKS